MQIYGGMFMSVIASQLTTLPDLSEYVVSIKSVSGAISLSTWQAGSYAYIEYVHSYCDKVNLEFLEQQKSMYT